MFEEMKINQYGPHDPAVDSDPVPKGQQLDSKDLHLQGFKEFSII